MPVRIPEAEIDKALAKLAGTEWQPGDDGTMVLDCTQNPMRVADGLSVFLGLRYRPMGAERMRLDSEFDAFYRREEFDPVQSLWWELARMWVGTKVAVPTDDQLHDALRALPTYKLPPMPEDEDEDTMPPEVTLTERLAYLADLGTNPKAPPVSARLARIIRAAIEEVQQVEVEQEQVPAHGEEAMQNLQPQLVAMPARTNNAQPAPPAIALGFGIIKGIADLLLQRYHFARDVGERLYVHQKARGTYSPGDLFVRQQVKTIMEASPLLSKVWSSHRGREVVHYLMLSARVLWEEPPANRINVWNGILDVDAGELGPHSPDFLSSIQIPVSYDADAKCPAWDKFIPEVFPPDAHELAWEILGDVITPDRSIEKAHLLVGEGGNGKSTFLNGLIAFVGRSNISTVALHDIEENRFAAARLYGKLANVCADLPSDHLKSTSVFKALTGGDVISAERKFEGGFDFRPCARLLFSANHPPRSDDASKAFFDRWVVIPFEGSFRGTDREKPRSEMDRALADPRELSGVLNRALPALRRVRRAGRFTETTSTAAALAEFQATTDPLVVWLARETVAHPNASVACGTLLDAYNRDCIRDGRPLLNQTSFGRAIRRVRPNIEKKRRGRDAHEHYFGLGLKAAVEQPR